MTIPIVGEALDGLDCYCYPEQMPEVGISRRWLYHGDVRSCQWQSGGIVKRRDQFSDHTTVEALEALLRECHARGVDRPSSYGDVFHKVVTIPPVRRSVLKLFPFTPGGWQAIRDPETGWSRVKPYWVTAPLFQYDMRSAYLWSLMQGLPDPRTYRSVRRVTGPGLYYCPSPNHAWLPYPWNSPGVYPATEEELLALPLPFRDVERGIRYDAPDDFDTGRYVSAIRSFSFHKKIAQAFWGRWGAKGKLMAQSLRDGRVSNEWETHDPRKNPVWAAIITSRVRLNMWRYVDNPQFRTYRIAVDSLVTDTPLDESPDIGGLVLKARFPQGGKIHQNGVEGLKCAA